MDDILHIHSLVHENKTSTKVSSFSKSNEKIQERIIVGTDILESDSDFSLDESQDLVQIDSEAEETSATTAQNDYDDLYQDLTPESQDSTQVPDCLDSNLSLEYLGCIHANINGQVVVESKCVHAVLDKGSLLCTEDRAVIGQVFDTFGPVTQPFYLVNSQRRDLALKMLVFYPPNCAKTIVTQELAKQKGSDALNLHDEEVDEEEQEFSDDEQEALQKRIRKKRNYAQKIHAEDDVLENVSLEY